MAKRIASIVLFLFHPLFFPTYGTLFIIAANHRQFSFYPLRMQLLWVIITFIFTLVCPVVWLVMMKRLELITDFSMENSKERIIPYIAIATFYMWMWMLFKHTNQVNPYTNQFISLMMLGGAISIFIGFFINIYRQISIHAIGAGAFVGLTLCLMGIADYDLKFFFVIVVLIGGLIGTSRLLIGNTKPNEIWAGYLTGFIGQFFSFTLLPVIFHWSVR